MRQAKVCELGRRGCQCDLSGSHYCEEGARCVELDGFLFCVDKNGSIDTTSDPNKEISSALVNRSFSLLTFVIVSIFVKI